MTFDVAWAVTEGETAAAIEEGKLVLTAQANDVAYTLVATVGTGNNTAEAEFEGTVSAPLAAGAVAALKAEFTAANGATLPATYEFEGVTFTVAWAVEPADGDAAKIVDGKLVLASQDAAADYTLVATVGTGNNTAEAEFEGTVPALPTAADAVAALKEKYPANHEFENGDVLDATIILEGDTYEKSFDIVWTVTADGTAAKVQEGMLVLTSQIAATNYTLVATVNGSTASWNGTVAALPDPAADTELSITYALALGASKAHNKYTASKYYVIGEVVEVYNTEYGNMKITDGQGNILTVYGTYSANGETRYDAMAVPPLVGDTVKVYGVIGQYNGTAQMKNGWLVEHIMPPITLADAVNQLKADYAKYDLSGFTNGAELQTVTKVRATEFATTWAVTSGNEAVAIVDGKLVLTPQATETPYTLVATVTDGTNNENVIFSYTVPAAESGEITTTTVSVSIANYATANGWTNGSQYNTLVMDSNVTVTANKTTGNNNTGKYYTNGNNWRMYQNEAPKIVVAAAAGKTIVSVKITYTVDKTGVLTLNGNNVASNAVVPVNASSVTFGVGNTGSATNGQVRITAIEVVYA